MKITDVENAFRSKKAKAAARIRNYYCADFHLKEKKKTVIFAVTSEFSTMLKKKKL